MLNKYLPSIGKTGYYLLLCVGIIQIKMSKKEYKKQEEKSLVVQESECVYQKKTSTDGITRFITQEALDKECLTLENSKELILRKVEQHFHRS